MPWTTPTDRATSYTVSAADWNIVEDNLAYLYSRPHFEVHMAAAQSIPNITLTTLNYDTVDVDNAGGWSASTHAYTIPTGESGFWMLAASMQWASNATGLRVISNPTTTNAQTVSAAVDAIGRVTITILIPLFAAQTITMQASQTSGGALNTGTWPSVWFSGVRVA